jgi:hypothetical protein
MKRTRDESPTGNVHFSNELPHPTEFRLRFFVGCHWGDECEAKRANVELAGKTSSKEVSSSGAAMLHESREDTVYATQCQSRVKIRRVRHGCLEYGFHRHRSYTSDEIALGTVPED